MGEVKNEVDEITRSIVLEGIGIGDPERLRAVVFQLVGAAGLEKIPENVPIEDILIRIYGAVIKQRSAIACARRALATS